MDAPKGRYRVEEKDGRLTVIDTLTGAPASPVSPSPRPGVPPPHRSGAVSSPPGLAERYGRLLLGLVVTRWDKEGRAVLAWEWEQNGRKQRWDAALGPAEQKRLGRALAAISAFPIFVMFTIFAGAGLTWLLLPVALPATFWGIWSVMRLKRETGTAGEPRLRIRPRSKGLRRPWAAGRTARLNAGQRSVHETPRPPARCFVEPPPLRGPFHRRV